MKKLLVTFVLCGIALVIAVLFLQRGSAPQNPKVSLVFQGMSNSPILGWVGIFSLTNQATSDMISVDYFVDAEVLQTNGWGQLTHSVNGTAVWALKTGSLKPSETHTFIVPEPATNQLWRFYASIRSQDKVADFIESFSFIQWEPRVYRQGSKLEILNRKPNRVAGRD